MNHLQINPHCDCKYPITWVAENIETCWINRNYKERHEPTMNGISISVRLPDNDDSWAEFAANDEGWMYVSDWRGYDEKILSEIPVIVGILEVETMINDLVTEHRGRR